MRRSGRDGSGDSRPKPLTGGAAVSFDVVRTRTTGIKLWFRVRFGCARARNASDCRLSALGNWKKLPRAAAFDEWIANPDRNVGNLLWDGVDDWVLIDHARALGAWPDQSTVPPPDTAVENRLAAMVAAKYGHLGPQRMRNELRAFGTLLQTLKPELLVSAAAADSLGLTSRATDALSFPEARIPHPVGKLHATAWGSVPRSADLPTILRRCFV
jgi:hypothetical protein